ncbi:MAG: PHP domain-containing protein [Candidatus Cloacimonetes bacterium]|nr:PHP domain-containing protein [Candidatus Cloacimonadota bacterium]
MIDLHLHTNKSDGSDEPFELIKKLIEMNYKVFSITDHDDLEANIEILNELKFQKHTINFITGCEISSVFEGRNLHLLCYGFDPYSEKMISMIEETASRRKQRITAIFEHLLNKHKVHIPEEEKVHILNLKIPGKVHIADAALKMGIKMKRQEFFGNCLDDMESREFKIEAERVIEIVSSAGGVVSFAHPIEVQKEYQIDIAELLNMTKRLKDKGLSAVEVYHSAHNERDVLTYSNIASELGLLVSGGSDYHGKNKDVEIGQLSNYGYVPDDDKITILSLLRNIDVN